MIFRPVVYGATTIGLGVLIALIGYLLETFAGVSVPSGGTSAVVPMIAAMIEGQAYVKRSGTAPAKSAMWQAALLMSVVSLLVSLAVIGLFYLVTGINVLAIFTALGSGIVLISFVVVMVLTVLMSRFGYGLGVKNQSKLQQK